MTEIEICDCNSESADDCWNSSRSDEIVECSCECHYDEELDEFGHMTLEDFDDGYGEEEEEEKGD